MFYYIPADCTYTWPGLCALHGHAWHTSVPKPSLITITPCMRQHTQKKNYWISPIEIWATSLLIFTIPTHTPQNQKHTQREEPIPNEISRTKPPFSPISCKRPFSGIFNSADKRIRLKWFFSSKITSLDFDQRRFIKCLVHHWIQYQFFTLGGSTDLKMGNTVQAWNFTCFDTLV